MQKGIYLAIILLLLLFIWGLVQTYVVNKFLVSISKTPKNLIKEILTIMDPQDGDYFLDLGAGDGRMLEAFSKNSKVKAVGYELSPILTYVYRIKSLFYPQARRKIELITETFFLAKIEQFDKIYCYLNEKALESLVPLFKADMKDSALIFSYIFSIPQIKPMKKVVLSDGETLFVYNKKSFEGK